MNLHLDIIHNAISTLKTLAIEYDGCIRVIEPHALGIGNKGTCLLRAFQNEGQSISGGIPEWRLFDVSKIGRVAITDGTFTPRPNYRRNDRSMLRILNQI